MSSLEKAVKTVFAECMKLKKNESCLVVSDSVKRNLALAFFEGAKKITDRSAYVEVLPPARNGEEPPSEIGRLWRHFDVVLLVTSRSFSHTKARKAACRSGARIASMPGITEEMAKRALDVDYSLMKRRSVKLARIFERGKTVKVTSPLGTDLEFSIEKHPPFTDFGIYSERGAFGNLPAGESGLAPDEGTANGVLVIDACMGTGILKEPVKITLRNGFAVKFEGKEAGKVKKQFLGLGKNAFNVAEFAVGLNPRAKITGIVLEDEKVLGTAHVALGNNISFGGRVNVPVHIDGVFRKPTVFVDGKKITERGKLLF